MAAGVGGQPHVPVPRFVPHGARLGGHLHGQIFEGLGGAAFRHALEHAGEDEGVALAHDPAGEGHGAVDRVPLPILDPADEDGGVVYATRGEGGVGGAQLLGGDPVGEAAQGQGEAGVVFIEGDAQLSGESLAAADAQPGKELHRRDVQRAGHRLPHGHPALVAAVGVGGGVVPEGGVLIQKHLRRRVPAFQGRGVDQYGFDDGAGLAADAGGPVVAQGHLLVPAPHQGGDIAGLGVHEADGSLGALSVHLGEELVLAEQLFAQQVGLPIHARVDAIPPGKQLGHGDVQQPTALQQGVVHVVPSPLQRRVPKKPQGTGGGLLGVLLRDHAVSRH